MAGGNGAGNETELRLVFLLCLRVLLFLLSLSLFILLSSACFPLILLDLYLILLYVNTVMIWQSRLVALRCSFEWFYLENVGILFE